MKLASTFIWDVAPKMCDSDCSCDDQDGDRDEDTDDDDEDRWKPDQGLANHLHHHIGGVTLKMDHGRG